MSRLVRMDQTGHTTLADWSVDDPDSTQRAMSAFREQLEQGCFAVVTDGPGQARQVRELPLNEALVIMRRPIAGG